MADAALEAEVIEGQRKPRICVMPDGDEHPLWPRVLEVLEILGFNLDPWQMDVLYASLLRRGDLWAAFTVAVCCPRQNGKNEIIEAREIIGALLLGEPLLIHTAHLADTCMEAFMRLDDRIDSCDWLLEQVMRVGRTNGREAVYFTNGSRIRFRTRTRGGGRGFAGSPVFFDEPMFFPVISQNAILPVMSAQPDPQAWYTGSAVDQTEHEDGVVFTRVRERALAGDDDRLAYFEWSLDVDTPDNLPELLADDPSSWAETNPALGIRITPEYIKAEREELTSRGFAVERLGVGDWPATDIVGNLQISQEAWDEAEDVASVMADPICVSFDVSPDRVTSIAIAGLNGRGKMQVELLERRAGTGWVPEFMADLCVEREVVELVCDGFGPGNTIAAQIEEKTQLHVRRLSSGEYADACGMFANEIEEGELVHSGQEELDDAVRGARTRPLVDRWAWSRSKSKTDPGPVIACSIALWSAVDRDVANREEMVIF